MTLLHQSSPPSRAAKIFHDHRLAQDGWNCRSSIADCPAVAGSWTLEGVATPLFQSSIGNQQSAMKTWPWPTCRGKPSKGAWRVTKT
jgi:hypothetical protein